MTPAANSRYQGIARTTLTRADGTEVACLQQRYLPDPDGFAMLAEHVVAEGDRLDNIAAVLLGDPELAWRIADANRAMRPGALTDGIGRRLRITLPDAVGALPNV
ncbi:LysM domain-containing protein [Polymorphobacter fuscus]|uniref:LysM domain-containing protein n=1 Tax=Sandarakinorhabdus fusca TaxID=1439888 RepID=A0A7C9GXG8_9SPHN|nr:LysM domain-containing protein [Polymorphobacter fuscus]KAB7647947.1 LysM domain-containing protein [Polymorphobacter fuscus]MQT17274.1 LysM domain-containing protein [Polymorphobacter fuscus]NJC08731.1 hypothetical protein [Polymorphobacter fuscus]